MKLLYFTPQINGVGGIERTLIDKANYLAEVGYEVLFVTYKNGVIFSPFYQISKKISHIDLGLPFYSLYRLSFYRRLSRYLIMRKQFKKKMVRIMSFFNPDIVVIATPGTDFLIHDIIAIAKGKRVVVESHVNFDSHYSNRPLSERLLYLFLNPIKAIRKSDLLIALTKGDAERWKTQKVHKIRVVPNPLSLYPTNVPLDSKKEGRIICVGRLDVQKRFDRVIDAFSIIASTYPQWYIDIYGEGIEKDNLQRQINELQLKNQVHLMGITNDVYSEFQNSQFFVFSSDYEGFGLVLIEAMSCGIPCISTDCPFGPSDIIEDKVDGLLCKMDVEDLAAKMEWMITHEKERTEMGIRARQAVTRYRKEDIMQEWERAYLSVL